MNTKVWRECARLEKTHFHHTTDQIFQHAELSYSLDFFQKETHFMENRLHRVLSDFTRNVLNHITCVKFCSWIDNMRGSRICCNFQISWSPYAGETLVWAKIRRSKALWGATRSTLVLCWLWYPKVDSEVIGEIGNRAHHIMQLWPKALL